MKSVQWKPYEDAAGSASEIVELLSSEDGENFGYAYGPGLSTIFGSARAGVAVTDGQWITVNDDGTIMVTHKEPVAPEDLAGVLSYLPVREAP